MILEHHRMAAAYYIANKEIRERIRGNDYDANRAHDRLVGVVEAAPDPYDFLDKLIRRLGRQRAFQIDIDREVIDLALIPATVQA